MAVHFGGDLPILIHKGGDGESTEEKWESFFNVAVSAKLLQQSIVDALSDEIARTAEGDQQDKLMKRQIRMFQTALKADANHMMRVRGLVGRPELNGRIAMVSAKMDPSSGRLPVNVINTETMAVTAAKVKAQNLTKALVTSEEVISMLEDQARRFDAHGHVAEAVALYLNVGCLDLARDAWKARMASVPPSPLFMTRLYERLAQVPLGNPCDPGELNAFVEGLDTGFCVQMVSRGLEALEAGQQAFYDFANAKQAVGMALSHTAYGGGDMRVAFFKHVCYQVDILLGGRLLDGNTLAIAYTNLGRSYIMRVCTPNFPLQNQQMVVALSLIVNERGAAVATPGSLPAGACHHKVAELLEKKFELAPEDETAGGVPLLHRALSHYDKALAFFTPNSNLQRWVEVRLGAANCAQTLLKEEPHEAHLLQVAVGHVKEVLLGITRQMVPALWAKAHGLMVRLLYDEIILSVHRGTYERAMSYETAEHARQALLGYADVKVEAVADDDDEEENADDAIEVVALRLTFARLLLLGCEKGTAGAVPPLEEEFRREAVTVLEGLQALPHASADLLKLCDELLEAGRESLAGSASK